MSSLFKGSSSQCQGTPDQCAFQERIMAQTMKKVLPQMCKNSTKQATNIYEQCATMNCNGKRSYECLHQTCKKDIDTFWEVSKNMLKNGPLGGSILPPSPIPQWWSKIQPTSNFLHIWSYRFWTFENQTSPQTLSIFERLYSLLHANSSISIRINR